MRKGIDSYPYFKHLVQLWLEGWEEQFNPINESDCEQNQHQQ